MATLSSKIKKREPPPKYSANNDKKQPEISKPKGKKNVNNLLIIIIYVYIYFNKNEKF